MMHIVVFLWVFLVGVIVAPLLKYFSEKTYFLVDVPDNDPLKIHKKNIPLVGGLVMGFCFFTGIIVVLMQYFSWQLAVIALAFFPVFSLGLYDDAMWKHISTIKPLIKFLCLLVTTFLSGSFLYGVGMGFNVLPFAILVIAGNFIYIFVVINAVNYQDGMDGLAGGLVVISLVV
jgi:UDP-GlcNAc:undecaprenyl-phosphate GlcNAc-1-phosphate transferase